MSSSDSDDFESYESAEEDSVDLPDESIVVAKPQRVNVTRDDEPKIVNNRINDIG